MKIGDKVRMIHDAFQGVVVRLLPDAKVDVEDDFGFVMPVLKKDLIVVSQVEKEYFNRTKNSDTVEDSIAPSRMTFKGILDYAWVNENHNMGLYLLNKYENEVFISVYLQKKESKYELLDAVILKAAEVRRISLCPVSKLENSEFLLFNWQILNPIVEPIYYTSKEKVQLKKWQLGQEKIEYLGKIGFLKTLVTQSKEISKDFLQENLFKNSEKSTVDEILKPQEVVDLHAEVLGIPWDLAPSDILRKQVQAFKSAMDGAIWHQMKELTFIHGVGNGVLKNEICSKIKDYSGVKYFEDAQKTKFGFGATKIVFGH